ncbi:IS1595 family transposase [Azospirillum sp. Sh1]|uniref:IS1595 family transposase n=1 Tax=Azospirillum sp. Sh1 TaxID=2607285 RepID=UPI0011EBF3AF|nr:IS1595 family transposase [Azospirillum sp. Sh1]KAA0577551.1 IS1595 family transposase [Azospirillum sp. Sh1]
MADALNPAFTDEAAAREWLEQIRWPDGAHCPHCREGHNPVKLEGKAHRPGLYQCRNCRKQFTVTVGTVYERSHIPLHKWLYATYLLSTSKKGMSAHQLHRMLGITYKSAWFMAHRIREAMTDTDDTPMGGPESTIEADETYFGQKAEKATVTTSGRPFTKGGRTGPSNKRCVVSLVERGGKVRSFHVRSATKASIMAVLSSNVDPRSQLNTDESRLYTDAGKAFNIHETVNHSAKEYARGRVHTNTIEGYFSIFKRGMKGIYQHCAEKHLHRYLTEFDFRYSNRQIGDTERTVEALKGAEGKRLTYRRIGEWAIA